MYTFKQYMVEDLSDVRYITPADVQAFDSAISPYVYTVKGSSSRTTTLVVRAAADDRKKVKSDIEKKLKAARIDFKKSRQGGSVGSTELKLGAHTLRITYKPTSGGMSETTLNSTITELVPALAFMAGRTKFTSEQQLYDFVSNLKGNDQGVYVDKRDMQAGHTFVETMPTSSKFKEKMQNAIGVLKYLDDLNNESTIDKVYWGYRKKPKGVASNHKGDLFVQFKSGSMLGVSLKAGGAKTKEPQLNTYVNKMFDDFGYNGMKGELIDSIYSNVHKQLGLSPNWMTRSEKSDSIDTIEDYREEYPDQYEALYDKMLDIVRDSVIAAVNKSKDDTIGYIKKQVLQKDDTVPLVVIKAIGNNYEKVTDEDQLDVFLPKVVNIIAYKSPKSKQNWFIELASKEESVIMNMSVRSNKPKPDNKIAQGFNLAVKFNGITVA